MDRQIKNRKTIHETHVQVNRLENRPQTLEIWGSSQLIKHNRIQIKTMRNNDDNDNRINVRLPNSAGF